MATKESKAAPSVAENPHGAAAPPRQSMAAARLVETVSVLEVGELPPLVGEGAGAGAGVLAAAFMTAPAVQAKPRELAPPAEGEDDGEATEPSLPIAAELVQENPHEQAAPPRESMAGAVLVSEEAPPVGASTLPPPPELPEARGELPQAVRSLPRRPRLRVTYSYDHNDEMVAELTLMNERRELIHRLTLSPIPGSTIAKIFEALTAVVATAARNEGVFGAVKE